MISSQEILEKLGSITPRRLGDQYSGEAAILVGIVNRERRPCFLLTRRTEDVATHKGQISFPGGMREPGDRSAFETALRETYEEVGVESESIEIIGEFHEYLAVTDHRVRCVVGFVSPEAKYRPQLTEVAYVLEVPLEFFHQADPVIERQFRQDRYQSVYFYDFNGETIWGLTARIIKDFVEFIYR